MDQNAIDTIINFIEISGTTDEKLAKLKEMNIENETYKKGVQELEEVVKYIRLFNVEED